jgi:hypothetical protein
MKTHGMLALAAWFALATPGTAAILTVGPGGTHATVQAAIDDAQSTPDDDELRLRATTFFEHLELFESDTGGRLEISGGWDAAFAVRDLEHESTGARISAGAPGSATLTNSIAGDNDGGDAVLIGGTATGSFNLVGVDPLFIDAGAGDYRLSVLSDAIDTGTASPPGGLGPFDLAHASRVAETLPDQGALERDALFADDFERGDTHAWSALVP